ncbi:MAG: HpcH/HpaI aldolase/citrate lyase family protein [Arenibacterium sp.]
MKLIANRLKAGLKAGQRQIGLWCTIPDTGVVEMLAACSYDWLLIDTEHAAMSAVDTTPLMQAAAAYPVSTVVRPGWNDPVEIKKILDCGAQSLLIPYVQNAEEAAAAVAATRYPPEGIRGVAGTTRASRYGLIKGYTQTASQEICVLVQAETAEALGNLEAIAAVDGVDGVFIGPADLAASMGHTGNPGHPDVTAAILDAMARLKAMGVPGGILSLEPTLLRQAEAAGAQFIAVGLDMALLRDQALARRSDWV